MDIRAAGYRRLLDTKTLRLEQFIEGQIPKYAIFSHRWTDEEVLYPKMAVLDENRTMKGYHKIVNLCKTAAADGYHYVWMDTACQYHLSCSLRYVADVFQVSIGKIRSSYWRQSVQCLAITSRQRSVMPI